jgi:hypothetical protein
MITIDWQPSRSRLRWFAAGQVAFAALAAAVIYRRTGWVALPAALVGAALLIGAAGWLRASLLRPVYLAWMLAAFPVGWLVSHVVLAAIFYLVLTPIGLALRLCGRDPLERGFDRGAASYWVPRPPEQGADRPFRQF